MTWTSLTAPVKELLCEPGWEGVTWSGPADQINWFTLREGKGLSVLCLHLEVCRRHSCAGDEEVIKEREPQG